MKIISNHKSEKQYGNKLKNGDIVYMRGWSGTADFYGIYSYGIGIIELEYGSSSYANTKDVLHLGDRIQYWTIEKVFRNCELIIKE